MKRGWRGQPQGNANNNHGFWYGFWYLASRKIAWMGFGFTKNGILASTAKEYRIKLLNPNIKRKLGRGKGKSLVALGVHINLELNISQVQRISRWENGIYWFTDIQDRTYVWWYKTRLLQQQSSGNWLLGPQPWVWAIKFQGLVVSSQWPFIRRTVIFHCHINISDSSHTHLVDEMILNHFESTIFVGYTISTSVMLAG